MSETHVDYTTPGFDKDALVPVRNTTPGNSGEQECLHQHNCIHGVTTYPPYPRSAMNGGFWR